MNYRKIIFTAPYQVEMGTEIFSFKIEDDNDVIIRNLYSQVSAGTELACLAGIESWFPLPGIPGYTAVGEVLETGSLVSSVKKGDLVYTFGPHAEYFKINLTDRWHGVCVKLPEGIKADYASFAHMADIAITSLRASEIELGDFVGVTGLGPIGNMAAQLAQLQGATVIGMDINEKRLELARKCGIRFALNSSSPDLKESLMKITDGHGITSLIEASGMSQVVESSIKLIAPYGELLLLGSPRASYNTNITETLQYVHLWEKGSITLKGAHEFTYPTFQTEFLKHSKERNSRINLQLIAENKLVIEPLYTHKLKPEQAKEAYFGLKDKKDEYIGVVFDWN